MRDLLGWLRPLPSYHLRLHWPSPRPDGVEWWMANFEELPGCMVQGNSMSEVEAKLWRILPGYLRQLRRRGVAVPAPLEAPPASIEGISVALAPGGVQARLSDPGVTMPITAPGGLRSVAARADVALLGS
jgi:predicted RNase H-like HicB family nuclease